MESASSGKKGTGLIIFLVILILLLYFGICAARTFVDPDPWKEEYKDAVGKGETAQEIIALSSGARLHYYPNHGSRNKYVVVCPGEDYLTCNMETEGYPVATELNRLGYTAFVLEYRVEDAITSFQAPVADLAEAIAYIDENDIKYNVYSGLYGLLGFSAGGNLVGLFGTTEYGYCHYPKVERPSVILMAYPWINPTMKVNVNLVKTANDHYSTKKSVETFLGKDRNWDAMRVQKWIDKDFPRCYIMQGGNDSVFAAEDNSDLLYSALTDQGIECRYDKYNVGHGCGLGIGTPAEGWLKRAMDFWEEKWYEDEFTPELSTNEVLLKRAGGFIAGVCHPNGKVDEAHELGADWVRIDISCVPYDREGNEIYIYQYFKDQIRYYHDQGFKVFAVTPYPNAYLAYGIDPRKEEDVPFIMEMARFFLDDLGDMVSAFQITNEMSEPQFRAPLTMQEGADFVGMQLRAMYRYRDDVLIGYNTSATDFFEYLNRTASYNKYCDYVALDLYLGCFESFTHSLGFATAHGWLMYIREVTNLPIIFTEFGYLSAGERMTAEAKLDLLHLYGAEGATVAEAEQYAKDHIRQFIEDDDFPPKLRERLKLICSTDDEMARTLFGDGSLGIDYSAHLYMELGEDVNLEGYPHTPEGQANYFTDFIDEVVLKNDNVCGAIEYCFCDSASCYVCGQANCPVETGWGLLDGEGNKKPAFYAIQEAFAKCKEQKSK